MGRCAEGIPIHGVDTAMRVYVHQLILLHVFGRLQYSNPGNELSLSRVLPGINPPGDPAVIRVAVRGAVSGLE